MLLEASLWCINSYYILSNHGLPKRCKSYILWLEIKMLINVVESECASNHVNDHSRMNDLQAVLYICDVCIIPQRCPGTVKSH